jgi:hypothetical protein
LEKPGINKTAALLGSIIQAAQDGILIESVVDQKQYSGNEPLMDLPGNL